MLASGAALPPSALPSALGFFSFGAFPCKRQAKPTPYLPSAQPRQQGGTSAGAEPLPEVTSECQHARWRPITGRTQPGGGKCRYGGPARPPWRRCRRVWFPRGRVDASGLDRRGSTAGGWRGGAQRREGWGRGANGLRRRQADGARGPLERSRGTAVRGNRRPGAPGLRRRHGPTARSPASALGRLPPERPPPGGGGHAAPAGG